MRSYIAGISKVKAFIRDDCVIKILNHLNDDYLSLN